MLLSPRTLRVIFVLVFFAAFVGALSVGSTDITPFSLLSQWHEGSPEFSRNLDIFFALRLPRVFVALLCGFTLACSGVLSQGLFRNPLASPSVLGVTAGGAAMASLVFLLGLSSVASWMIPAAAFAGCYVAMMLSLVFVLRRHYASTESLLLYGLAIGSLFSAVTSLSVSLSLDEHQRLPQLMYWLLGSIELKSLPEICAVAVLSVLCFAFALRQVAQLDVLALGDEVASSLSVDTRKLQLRLIVLIALFEALSLSIAGAITFVGLIIPHITRKLIGPAHRDLLFYSAMNGASLLLLSDLVARTVRAPAELNVGIIVLLLGSLFFVYLVHSEAMRKRGDA